MGKFSEQIRDRFVKARETNEPIQTLDGVDGHAIAALFVISMMRQRYLEAEKDINAELDEGIAIFTSISESFRNLGNPQ